MATKWGQNGDKNGEKMGIKWHGDKMAIKWENQNGEKMATKWKKWR